MRVYAKPCGALELGRWASLAGGSLSLRLPPQEGENGVGESVLYEAARNVYGADGIVELAREKGSVEEAIRSVFVSKPVVSKDLVVEEVVLGVLEAGCMSGKGARSRQATQIAEMLERCNSKEEASAFCSMALGRSRWGIGQLTVLESCDLVLEKDNGWSRAVYSACPNWQRLFQVGMEEGVILEGGEMVEEKEVVFEGGESPKNNIEEVVFGGATSSESTSTLPRGLPMNMVEVGTPVLPMLAVAGCEIRGRTAMEWKYDGERVQIHVKLDGDVMAFSRNGNDVTVRFADVVNEVAEICAGEEMVLDGEVVAVDEEGRFLPFQILSKRGRLETRKEVKARFFGFDILVWKGKSCLGWTYAKRRKVLEEVLGMEHVAYQVSDDVQSPHDITSEADKAVSLGAEGLMLKLYNSVYLAGTRNATWQKFKPSEQRQSQRKRGRAAGIGDSLDLVPVAAYRGKGNRSKGFGSFLLACYDPENNSFKPICRIGTGLSEETLQTLNNTYSHLPPATPENIPSQLEFPQKLRPLPDIWIHPFQQVWEVRAAELSKSPTYQAAGGIALRFPRLVRIRTDKSPEQATDEDYIRQLAKHQGDL